MLTVILYLVMSPSDSGQSPPNSSPPALSPISTRPTPINPPFPRLTPLFTNIAVPASQLLTPASPPSHSNQFASTSALRTDDPLPLPGSPVDGDRSRSSTPGSGFETYGDFRRSPFVNDKETDKTTRSRSRSRSSGGTGSVMGSGKRTPAPPSPVAGGFPASSTTTNRLSTASTGNRLSGNYGSTATKSPSPLSGTPTTELDHAAAELVALEPARRVREYSQGSDYLPSPVEPHAGQHLPFTTAGIRLSRQYDPPASPLASGAPARPAKAPSRASSRSDLRSPVDGANPINFSRPSLSRARSSSVSVPPRPSLYSQPNTPSADPYAAHARPRAGTTSASAAAAAPHGTQSAQGTPRFSEAGSSSSRASSSVFTPSSGALRNSGYSEIGTDWGRTSVSGSEKGTPNLRQREPEGSVEAGEWDAEARRVPLPLLPPPSPAVGNLSFLRTRGGSHTGAPAGLSINMDAPGARELVMGMESAGLGIEGLYTASASSPFVTGDGDLDRELRAYSAFARSLPSPLPAKSALEPPPDWPGLQELIKTQHEELRTGDGPAPSTSRQPGHDHAQLSHRLGALANEELVAAVTGGRAARFRSVSGESDLQPPPGIRVDGMISESEMESCFQSGVDDSGIDETDDEYAREQYRQLRLGSDANSRFGSFLSANQGNRTQYDDADDDEVLTATGSSAISKVVVDLSGKVLVSAEIDPNTTHIVLARAGPSRMVHQLLYGLASARDLVVLDLSHCELSDISPVAACSNLRELDIKGNRLANGILPSFISAALPALEVLIADSCGLTALPFTLCPLRLHTLSLRNNALVALPSWLSRLPLEQLLLDGNPFGPRWVDLVQPLMQRQGLGLSGGVPPSPSRAAMVIDTPAASSTCDSPATADFPASTNLAGEQYARGQALDVAGDLSASLRLLSPLDTSAEPALVASPMSFASPAPWSPLSQTESNADAEATGLALSPLEPPVFPLAEGKRRQNTSMSSAGRSGSVPRSATNSTTTSPAQPARSRASSSASTAFDASTWSKKFLKKVSMKTRSASAAPAHSSREPAVPPRPEFATAASEPVMRLFANAPGAGPEAEHRSDGEDQGPPPSRPVTPSLKSSASSIFRARKMSKAGKSGGLKVREEGGKGSKRQSFLQLEVHGGGPSLESLVKATGGSIAGEPHQAAGTDKQTALRTLLGYLRDLDDLNGVHIPLPPVPVPVQREPPSTPSSVRSGSPRVVRHSPSLGALPSQRPSTPSLSPGMRRVQSHRRIPGRQGVGSEVSTVMSDYSALDSAALGSPSLSSSITDDKSKLKVDSAKREAVINELVATERTYVKGLRELCLIYIGLGSVPVSSSSGKKDTVLPAAERRAVFGNVEAIHDFHSQVLLPELEAALALVKDEKAGKVGADGEVVSAAREVAKVFIRHTAFLKIYSSYVNGFDGALAKIQSWSADPGSRERSPVLGGSSPNPGAGAGVQQASRLSTNQRKRIKSYMKKCKAHPLHSQISLQSYLLLPVQRIPRYKLLLEALQSVTAIPVPAPDLLAPPTSADLSALTPPAPTLLAFPDSPATPPGTLIADPQVATALELVADTTSAMNERKRESENRELLLRWQSRITAKFRSPLVQPHRILVRPPARVRLVRRAALAHGSGMLEFDSAGVDLIALLCTDLLVLVREPADGVDGTGPVELFHVLRLSAGVGGEEEPVSLCGGEGMVRLVDVRNIYYLQCRNRKEAKSWMAAVNLQQALHAQPAVVGML